MRANGELTRPLVALVAVAALLEGLVGCDGQSSAPTGVVLTVDASHPGAALPGDFLGLSFEASVLGSPVFDPSRSDLPNFLRDLGTGRLRFGGNSVDRVTAWTGTATSALPTWAHSRVTEDDLARLEALAAATGWKVDLGLTLGHPDPSAAADEASAAARLIGPGLGTVQIGNEPDAMIAPSPYRTAIAAYRAAIAAAAPSARLSGPDTADPAKLAAYTAAWGGGLAVLTQHFYPWTRCGGVRPTISQLLSPETVAAETRLAEGAVAEARALGVPVRIDETNSASCGGQDGVSNTLASALWITEYLLVLAHAGVSGVGIQGGLAACRGYTPLCVPGAAGAAPGTAPGIDPVADTSLGAAADPGGRLAAQPDFYGLLVIRELERGRWVPLAGPVPEPLYAAAVVMPDGAVRLVVVNPSPDQSVELLVRGGRGRAGAQFLAGPSLSAVSGVSLGDAAVGADGRWVPGPDRLLVNGASGVRLSLPAATAALVTIAATP